MKIGDKVIYEHMGVCEIIDITVPSFCKGGVEKEYYVLRPNNQSGSIFVPVDADVYMRPLLTKEEADKAIDMIPSIEAETFGGSSMQELKQHYAEALQTHDCGDLIELLMSIYAKKQARIKNNQKMGSIDEGVMRRAEELLYTEFSFALGIPKDAVQKYIAQRMKASK